MKLLLGTLLYIVCAAQALFPPGSAVIDLTPSNFHQKVVNSDEVWIVEFYAPWCGHCKSLVPEYEKAAKALKGIVKIGGVNADEHKSLAGQYQVTGFPTLKIFGNDKMKPTPYNGQRTAAGIVEEAIKAAREMAMEKLTGKKGGSGGHGGGNDVVEITDSNFEQKILKSDDLWLVMFFAPWCGHCKNLSPHWDKAASELKGKVQLGSLDATIHSVKAGEYEVRGYPTIKFFNKGEVEEYNGGRTSDDIVRWATEKLSANVPAPEITQITSDKLLANTCQKNHPICVIAVLPHILDCQSSCRNKYISMLNELGDKFKSKLWGWGWTEAAAQTELETALELGGFGYPALAALNVKKMQFASFKGSFSTEGIREFLRDISFGRGSITPIRKAELPKIVKSDPWDGKDGALPLEEDIDLDDVVLDDLKKDEL